MERVFSRLYCRLPAAHHAHHLQSGALYPANLLLFLPFPVGLDLSLILHFVIAAAGAFVLTRELCASVIGATIAGVSFGFGPFLGDLRNMARELDIAVREV